MHDEMREPTEEELRAAIEEQMRRIRVEDVVLQTVATLVNLAGQAPGPAGRPRTSATWSRPSWRSTPRGRWLPLCPPEQQEPIRQALSQLQMAFAREATGDSRSRQGPGRGRGAGRDRGAGRGCPAGPSRRG